MKTGTEEKKKKKEGARFVRYFGPMLDALRALGGSGTPDEVVERIALAWIIHEVSSQKSKDALKG